MNEDFLKDLENNTMNVYYIGGKCYKWDIKQNKFLENKKPSLVFREFG